MFHHRSGKLKQKNKKHKNRGHLASKRAIKREDGGKVNNAAGSAAQPRVGPKQQSLGRDLKQDRLNRARQLKEQKRSEQFLQRRVGSTDGPPRIVAILPLSALCNTTAVRDALLAAHGDAATATMQQGGAQTVAFKGLKQRFTFLLPRFGLMEALEAAKVADLAMFVLDVSRGSEGAIGEEGDLIISAIRAQGLPVAMGIIQGLEMHQGLKSQGELRRFGHRFFETEFGDKAKIADASNAAQLQRVLSASVAAGLHWRQTRAYVMADRVAWAPAAETESGAEEEGHRRTGTLTVRGYVRGKPLCVNQLIHLPGVGTFSMGQIRRCRLEPCPLRKPRKQHGVTMEEAETVEEEEEVLVCADPAKVEALTSLADPDELAGEQTWPTREEEEEAAAAAMAMDGDGDEQAGGGWARHKKKLMKSMSEYQAAWFEGEEEEGDEDVDDESGMREDDEDDDASLMAEDASLMAELEAQQHQHQRGQRQWAVGDGEGKDVAREKEKRKLEAEELEFPDEVQTPEDTPARERFARYRALKSFRTSPWDPYESLPREYARIFKFQNFQASHSRVLAEMEEVERAQNQMILSMLTRPRAASTATGGGGMDVDEGGFSHTGEAGAVEAAVAAPFDGFVASGTYVSVDIVGVPEAAAAAAARQQEQGLPVVAFALLRYENRTSVLHFNIQKYPTYEPAVKSKERLLFYTGFRSFEARPIFSDLNLNCDKHKFSRFLHAGRFAVASVYGPVSMPPCPVLIFKEARAGDGDGDVVVKRELVASGTLHAVNPDRIILKRIVLTGYPIRVKRSSAVVKHMFYNPEDVKWFKPAELGTKQGAAGHIRMPVGTHGLMKVRFNRVIQQSDTVCLALYKRVYPKFVEEE